MGTNRVPPNNIDAERTVLGSMLMPDEGRRAIQKVLNMGLAAPHFYRDTHKIIFDAILSLYHKNISADLLTVTKELEQTNNLREVGGVVYLDEMIDAAEKFYELCYNIISHRELLFVE